MSPPPESPHESRPHTRLAVWMAVSVAVFVLVGSLSLVAAFQRNFDREDRRAFEDLARTNVGFLEHARLPRSDRLAAELGRIIGARVFFLGPHSAGPIGAPRDTMPPAAMAMACDGKVHSLPDGEWMVGLVEKSGAKVVFLRPAASRVLAMDRPDTWLALGGFWALSFALGWWLARAVTHPLHSLAASLPLVGTEAELPPLPDARRDEIGRLARTLIRTHQSLREERDRRRAAERQAMLGRMAASLAHEVKNPLAAIRLHAQLLEEAVPAEAAVSRTLIQSEAARIEQLLGQWLGLAKPAPPVWSEVDPAEEIAHPVRLIGPQAAHAKVALAIAPCGAVAPLAADRHRLRQVLHNLLLNAIQAQPHGGKVTVSLADDGQRVVTRIEDEGPGFSAAALARLGEPFYSEKEGGMGLGLTVVREICEAHGGSLTAENLPGGGARVRVEFARRPPTAAASSQ